MQEKYRYIKENEKQDTDILKEKTKHITQI